MILGQTIVVAVFSFAVYFFYLNCKREQKEKDRLISQSKTLAAISNTLSGSAAHPRERVKTVTELIQKEVGPDGFECRITVHKSHERYFPPSGGKFGVHMPILAGDVILGTMSVTHVSHKPFSPSEQSFFSAIAYSLGIYLHRSRLWESLQKELQTVEAKMMIDATQASDNKIVREMIDVVEKERGRWIMSEEECSLKEILDEEILLAREQAEKKKIEISLLGDVDKIPLISADKEKLKQLVSHYLYHAIVSTPSYENITVSVKVLPTDVSISFQDRANGGVPGPLGSVTGKMFDGILQHGIQNSDINLGFMVCKNILDHYDGRMWAESKGFTNGRVFSFSLPLNTVDRSVPRLSDFVPSHS